ncbi:MAG: hypothetical protein M5U28_18060 [Sandaracinaceae bacterium]|nr:hypothetical protein [Sandaracinaceae bacterium]
MDWLSTDPDRPGVFAVGQEACGIFALGQLATGVVAIGQVARGVVAIGQGAVGVVAIGQGALGVLYGAGMVAVGGRGFGLALKLLPKVRIERFERPALPPLSRLEQLRAGEPAHGWLLARVEDGALTVDGAPLELEATAELAGQLREAVQAGHTHACVTVEVEDRAQPPQGGYRQAAPRERVLVGKRIKSWREAQPRVHLEGPLTDAVGLVVRAVGMAALAWAWWLIAGADITAMVLGK